MVDPIWLLAMAIMGEAGAVPEAMPMVANCVVNRVEDGRWPDTVIEVLEQPGQFNGRAIPSSLALYYARRALRRTRAEKETYEGIFFVLSGDDRRELGCDVGDVIYVDWKWSVHGYREWCVGKGVQ